MCDLLFQKTGGDRGGGRFQKIQHERRHPPIPSQDAPHIGGADIPAATLTDIQAFQAAKKITKWNGPHKIGGQKKDQQQNTIQQSFKDEEFEKQIAGKTPEEQKKLRELRHQLHAQYYQKLVNPPKQQEERPAEKMEKEKMQEMQELEQKEAKKPAPLAVSMAREKTEKFPGASG